MNYDKGGHKSKKCLKKKCIIKFRSTIIQENKEVYLQ